MLDDDNDIPIMLGSTSYEYIMFLRGIRNFYKLVNLYTILQKINIVFFKRAKLNNFEATKTWSKNRRKR